MAERKLKVTRDQLAEFIDNHDTIRQFERLLDYVNAFVSVEDSLIQDIAHPIGEPYIQYPGKPDPNELYPGQTWEDISSEFAGDFFRVEGGAAEVFESGEQSDALREHKHWMATASSGGSETLRYSTVADTDARFSGTTGAIHTSTPEVADETRPVNQTIRVWERTA